MNINEVWQKMEPTGSTNGGPDPSVMLGKMKPAGILERIRQNLLISAVWGCLLCPVFPIAMYWIDIFPVKVCFAIVFLACLWLAYTNIRLYAHLKKSGQSADDMLSVMQYHFQSIKKWIRSQELTGVFVYPVSITGGFLFGLVAGSGKPVQQLMEKPAVWMLLLACVAILTPLCYVSVKYIFRYIYGKHLIQLEKNIAELSQNG